jgi:hypothetical protein
MWLMTNRGFFSIVEDRDDPSRLLVRSRHQDDIGFFFQKVLDNHPDFSGNTFSQVHSDYPYRLFAPREYVMEVVVDYMNNIDYDNFKNSVRSPIHKSAYGEVWGVMYDHFYGERPQNLRDYARGYLDY